MCAASKYICRYSNSVFIATSLDFMFSQGFYFVVIEEENTELKVEERGKFQTYVAPVL